MLYKCYKWALSKKPWKKGVPKMRFWNWWKLPSTIYLPVWCWRLETIKPVKHHSACGPAAWKHRTKNISQTLQLSCKRTVPTMTLVSWHWYEPIRSQRNSWDRWRLCGASPPWSRWRRLVLVYCQGGWFSERRHWQLRRLAPKVINPVRQHHSQRMYWTLAGRFQGDSVIRAASVAIQSAFNLGGGWC